MVITQEETTMDEGKLTTIKKAATEATAQIKIILDTLEGVTIPKESTASHFGSPLPETHTYDALVAKFGGNEGMAAALLDRTIGTPGSNPLIKGSWNERQEARDFYKDHPELFTINPFPEGAIDPNKFGA